MANPECKNFLFEPDGYCTQCGKNHFTVNAGEVKFVKVESEIENKYKELQKASLPREVDDVRI